MKIEAGGISANQLETTLSLKQTPNSIPSAATSRIAEDRTSLSSDSVAIKSLVNQAMATPDVRHDKVAQLRQAMNSGVYKIDIQKLAAAITADSPE